MPQTTPSSARVSCIWRRPQQRLEPLSWRPKPSASRQRLQPPRASARLRGQQPNEQWPPALAFEGLEAGVETVLGSLLRDDVLVEQGRMRQAKVAQLRKAEQLETLADATERENALKTQQQALDEAETADVIDISIAATKEARKSS